MIGAWVLLALTLAGFFAPFLSPYDPTIAGRNRDYLNVAPQIPQFCDHNGCSWRPFLHTLERTRSIHTNFRWVTTVNTEKRRYVQFFVQGWEYRLLGLDFEVPGTDLRVDIPGIALSTHLFGVDQGGIHLFGTDAAGKDIFSRTLHAI